MAAPRWLVYELVGIVSGLIEQQPPIDTRHLFASERDELLSLLGSLASEQWQLPTVCDGWSVHDVALHLLWGDISNLSRRRDGYFGRAQDSPGDLTSLESVIALVNTLNDNWLRGARRMSPQLVQSLLRSTGREWVEWVTTVDIEALGDPVGWAGPEPAPVWLDIAREFTERWVHQQHIRDAVGIPGNTEPRFLKPVLATFAMALPYVMRGVDAPPGTRARLTIAGESGGMWTVVRSARTWVFDSRSNGETEGSVSLDQDVAWRLFTRGIDRSLAMDRATITGSGKLTDAMLNMVTILA